MAGHDYCNYGEIVKLCEKCPKPPLCGRYTEWGIKNNNKKPGERSANQNGLVKAVNEFFSNMESSYV